MGTLTIQVPDDTHERLRRLAEFDAEPRFRVRAGRGSAQEGLRLLDELEQAYAGRGAPHAAAQRRGRYRVRKRPI